MAHGGLNSLGSRSCHLVKEACIILKLAAGRIN